MKEFGKKNIREESEIEIEREKFIIKK